VVWAAFAVAVFGWGTGYYGPSMLLHAVRESRGWSVTLIATAISAHFLASALAVANLARLHHWLGLVGVTRAAGIATALGLLGWALAEQPWQLFAATLLTGFGWAGTGGAAINAMVSPWFARRRLPALSSAYNGASLGGVLFPPLWVGLIGIAGFKWAVVVIGAAMALVLWWLSGRYFARTPADMGLAPDGDAFGSATRVAESRDVAPIVGPPWQDRRALTLMVCASLSLAAQIGLITHLYSLLVPALGMRLASLGIGLATVCAIVGRTALGWLLPVSADRRRAAAASYALQGLGSLAFVAAGGGDWALLFLGIVLFGLGIGNAASLPPLIAQQDFRPADTARIVALTMACTSVANALAPAAFGVLRDLSLEGGAGGAATALFLAAAMAQFAAAAVAAVRLGPPSPKPSSLL
jgi:MFS family permease